MTYPMHKRLKPGRLTDEECDVQDALREYNFEPEDSTVEDFVPTTVLYEKYRHHVVYVACGNTKLLTPGQFGLALQRVFGVELDRKFRRRVGGRAVNGYAYVTGPGSVKTHLNPGRPKPKAKDAGPEQAAPEPSAACLRQCGVGRSDGTGEQTAV